MEPQGPQCHLPKENPVVVDIAGESVGYLYALFSDGTVWFWGGGYPTSRYYRGPEDAELCLTAIDMNRHHAGLSFDHSITLLDYDQLSFTFKEQPHTMDLPGAVQPVAIQSDRDFIALDEHGNVWALLQRDPPINRPPSGAFQLLDLPAPASAIEADAGYCARLVTGEVWCLDRNPDDSGRFGMGLGLALPELTKLPIDGAKDFFLGFSDSCWLDEAGAMRCAGQSVPDPEITSLTQPTYHLVPNVPPFKKIWLRQQGGGCALAEDDELWCWGYDVFGIAPNKVLPPTPVGSFPGLKDVSMTFYTTCVLRADNKVVCQGSSSEDNSCGPPDENGWWTITFGECGGGGL